jgi:hypothetical protein
MIFYEKVIRHVFLEFGCYDFVRVGSFQTVWKGFPTILFKDACFLGRNITVPIQLKCPNGHHLTAKESNAGKVGKCPVCKAAVTIPVLHRTAITDSAIVSILGDLSAVKRVKKVTPKPVVPPAGLKSSSVSSSSTVLPHIRLCPNCEREIDMGYHICPHCHTYITSLNDF